MVPDTQRRNGVTEENHRFASVPYRPAPLARNLTPEGTLPRQASTASYASLLLRMAFTCCGFALPFVAFITCPTSELKAFSLPLR